MAAAEAMLRTLLAVNILGLLLRGKQAIALSCESFCRLGPWQLGFTAIAQCPCAQHSNHAPRIPAADPGAFPGAGAAPGSWTAHLAQHARLVVAVDPAEMHPEALQPNVRHLQVMSDVALDLYGQVTGGELADLLCCDMNQHPEASVRFLKPMMRLLKPGGWLIVTFKLRGLGRDRSALAKWFSAELGSLIQQDSVRCFWLLANTIHERTFMTRTSLASIVSLTGTSCLPGVQNSHAEIRLPPTVDFFPS